MHCVRPLCETLALKMPCAMAAEHGAIKFKPADNGSSSLGVMSSWGLKQTYELLWTTINSCSVMELCVEDQVPGRMSPLGDNGKSVMGTTICFLKRFKSPSTGRNLHLVLQTLTIVHDWPSQKGNWKSRCRFGKQTRCG